MKILSFTNRRIVNENTPHNSLAILKLEFVRFTKMTLFLSQGRDGLIKLWEVIIEIITTTSSILKSYE